DVVVVKTPFGNIGLMVCYDLRFPELALNLRAKGANLLTAPSAFTYTTGEMHWQLLLQTRALDSQCSVLGFLTIRFWTSNWPYLKKWGDQAVEPILN
ncbi:nitrilase-related carbon-nitrogen hydrolase, partial [Klebsiella pneumoniae]|uniref:nitrilase-related carbon-nitrogen hydrolase n=1 Tax=Klebsiella pneumoniae TaxID=573 RepID=UPI00277B5965